MLYRSYYWYQIENTLRSFLLQISQIWINFLASILV